MEFLIDMPLSSALALWLRNQSHNAIHASEIGLDRSSDIIILERARSEKRIVITADLDYPRLLALVGAEGPGLILFRGGEYSEAEVVERLKETLRKVPEDEISSSVVVIEKWRIRRRRLPLELPFKGKTNLPGG